MENNNVFKQENEVWDITKRILIAVFFAIAITFALSLLVGFKYFIVRTGSMTPRLPVYTMVMVDNTDYEDLKIGDIITYRSNDASSGITYTHRVVDYADDGTVITKGDADVRLEKIPENRYIGKVVYDNYIVGRLIMLVRENIILFCVVAVVILFLWYVFI